jgi:tRNA-Thr(GGU) m(6)t(6)A37 methyltransferase TsaA
VIQVEAAWVEALDGIERFSHIWVLWWLDRFRGPPSARKVHPEGRPEMPLVGLFATRSPHRPNPIAMTAVRLLNRDGVLLRVEGLDAIEGTPILDIKPYLRRGDCLSEAVMPDWLERLWLLHDEERAARPGTE